MKPTITKFGLFALITAAILFLAALVLGKELSFSTQEVIGYLSIVISLSFVFFGILHYRNKENDGRVTFGKAFTIGILISMFAAFGFAVIDYLYTTVINPEFIDEYMATMEANGQEMEHYSSSSLALFMFAIVLVIGIIVTLLSAFILQRK